MSRRSILLAGFAALFALSACSSDEKHEHLSPDCCDAAQVTTARTTESVSESSDSRKGRTSEPSTPSAHAQTPRGTPPSGPRDVRAERERVIEEAAAEDRKSGGSEVVIEPDGSVYRPGVGVLPRYTVRTIDKKDGPAPDPGVMKLVPGSTIELPPPAPKPPQEVPGHEQPGGSLLVPKEAK
ncbi:MAG: hypothetical protein ACAI25_08105 [Planctomycetota bacterium]